MKMRSMIRLLVVCCLVMSTVIGTALAGEGTLLWSNGDGIESSGGTALSNEREGNVSDSRLYEDFTVTAGEVWNLTSTFSDNWFADNGGFQNRALVEIRSGITVGDGGTVLFSQILSATRSFVFDGEPLDKYRVTVTNLDIELSEGTYFLAVTPYGTLGAQIFVSATEGANAVGAPGLNNSAFHDSDHFLFADWREVTDGRNFALGIYGSVIPEPTTCTLALAALCLVMGRRRALLEGQRC